MPAGRAWGASARPTFRIKARVYTLAPPATQSDALPLQDARAALLDFARRRRAPRAARERSGAERAGAERSGYTFQIKKNYN